MGFYTTRRNLYTAPPTGASGITSEVAWVGDARSISLWLDGSTQTVQGSNDEGRSAALAEANWSTLTRTVASATMMDIEPGLRWLRVQRSGSSGTAFLSLQQHV